MKKVIFVLLAASIVFGLIACGQQRSSETKAADETAAADESKTEGQSRASKDGAVWEIGDIGLVTGGVAVCGLVCKNTQ